MGSISMQARRAGTPASDEAGPARAPGKHTRVEHASAAPAAAAQPAAERAPAVDDWTMGPELLGAFGLGAPQAEPAPVQRKASTAPSWDWRAPIQAHGLSTVGSAPDALGGGSLLPAPVQAKMEDAFATDFSDVRVHQGPQASQLGALAYTQGSDLCFAPGQYDPHSESGQRLIGHELAHVVQQRNGRVEVPQGKDSPVNSDPGLEAEADAAGDRAARGEAAHVAGAAGGGVQRAVIQRKGEQLSNDVAQRASNLSINLQSVNTKDPYNLQHKGGEVDMWVNPTNTSMAQNPQFEQAAKLFEQRLGQYLANDSAPVRGMAAALNERAREVAEAAFVAKNASAETELGKWFGTDNRTRIGAVGKDKSVLEEVFSGGSLRERMTMMFNFMWVFSDYLINMPEKQIGELTESTKLDGLAFLNKSALLADHRTIARDENGKALDKETLTGTPDPKLHVGQQYETRALSGGEKNSGLTVKGVEESHKLTERELRHMFNDKDSKPEELGQKHGAKELPWELGYKRWAMNENHEWVQAMRKLSLPTAAGPSATAWRVIKTAKHLGFTDRAELDMVRLAAAGYLLTIRAHSLIEVLDGAEPEGVTPHNRDQTLYTNLPPLPTSFLRQHIGGGRFPHEPPEDRSLNTPLDQSPQQLDQEQSGLAAITSDRADPLLPQGTKAKYKVQYLDGKDVNPDAYRMDWYWIDASQSDVQQPRAVATEYGQGSFSTQWNQPGQYKIYCVLYKINRPPKEPDGSDPLPPLVPLGVLRFDHGVAPSTKLPKPHEPKRKKEQEPPSKKEEEDSSDEDLFVDMEELLLKSSQQPKDVVPKLEQQKPQEKKRTCPVEKVPVEAWHRTAMDEIEMLDVEAEVFDEHDTGKWNAELRVPVAPKSKERHPFYAKVFASEPVEAMRAAIELWRLNQVSSSPKCKFPQGRLDLFGRVGEEAVREQFFVLGAPDNTKVKERVPTFRVQGGELGGKNATWVQLLPDEEQGLDVVHQATVWTNFGDVARMIKWLDKRTDRSYCLFLEVESQYVQGLAKNSIPEAKFIELRRELALHLRALKELHEGELSQFVAETEDRQDQLNTQRVVDEIEKVDLQKKVETQDQQRYAELKKKEMSVLMQKAEQIYYEIEGLQQLIDQGLSAILSSDHATHQYGVTDRNELAQQTLPGTVREVYQMRTLHLEKSQQESRSIGSPAEDFSSTDYFKMRNIPFIGVVPEDGQLGVVIKSVMNGSPAATSGVQANDLLLSLGGTNVTTVAEYTQALTKQKTGQAMQVRLQRGNQTLQLEVTPQKP